MESDINSKSLEKLIGYYEQSDLQASAIMNPYGISDFNNVETADKKLIINDNLEFWVHDCVLNNNCDYFIINTNSKRKKQNSFQDNLYFKIEDANIKSIPNKSNNLKIVSNPLNEEISEFNIDLRQNYKNQESNDNINDNISYNKFITEDDFKSSTRNSNTVNLQLSNKNESNINITKINLPNNIESNLIFDVLLWMYTKDKGKLKKIAKKFENLLNLLSLGIFLKMKDEYFKVLLSNLNYVWDKKLFSSPLWSRDKLSFKVLDKLIPLIDNNYLRIYALISYLKSIDLNNNQILTDTNTIKKCLRSKELFFVRNYIKKYKLLENLTKEQLLDLKNNFELYMDSLDISGILNSYVFNPLYCIVCKNTFESPYQIIENKNCIVGKYHPPCGILDNCKHKGCNKKLKKGEFYCCHKKHSEKDSGCLLSEGRHIIVFKNKNKSLSSH